MNSAQHKRYQGTVDFSRRTEAEEGQRGSVGQQRRIVETVFQFSSTMHDLIVILCLSLRHSSRLVNVNLCLVQVKLGPLFDESIFKDTSCTEKLCIYLDLISGFGQCFFSLIESVVLLLPNPTIGPEHTIAELID